MIYTIKNEYLTVAVNVYGAELQSVQDSSGREFLWQGDETHWDRRAINLFPYIARLTQGSYYLDGQLYKMNSHGIAPYRDFTLTEKTDRQMTFQLCSDGDTYAQYPREFAFRVIYALEDNTLHIRYEVENRDSRTMYFGLGGHPGFQVPMEDGKTFEDYRLRFAEACVPQRVGFTEKCFLNGEMEEFSLVNGVDIPLRHDLFDRDAIVLEHMAQEVTLEAEGGKRAIRVCYPQMPYLGIWHKPHSQAPYVCIEPWCSLPSTQDEIAVFETQKNLLSCAPGQCCRNDWSITLEYRN